MPSAAPPAPALLARRRARSGALLAAAWLAVAGPAQAERGDRYKELVIESDSTRGATMDLTKRSSTIAGNVVVTQGTMQIRADRIELREFAEGRRTVVAYGVNGQPASFRQKRDGVNEHVEATGERIEYDSASERLRFVGDARVRRTTPAGVADEAQAQVIAYDSVSDVVSLQGAGGAAAPAAGASAAAPGGRTRLVLSPRESAPPASAASAPTSR